MVGFSCLFQSPQCVEGSHSLSLVLSASTSCVLAGVHRGVSEKGVLGYWTIVLNSPWAATPKPQLTCLYCPASVHYAAAFYSVRLIKILVATTAEISVSDIQA